MRAEEEDGEGAGEGGGRDSGGLKIVIAPKVCYSLSRICLFIHEACHSKVCALKSVVCRATYKHL